MKARYTEYAMETVGKRLRVVFIVFARLYNCFEHSRKKIVSIFFTCYYLKIQSCKTSSSMGLNHLFLSIFQTFFIILVMVSYIITSLTLDTLPRDVIRLIIRSNVGENKDNLRLVSFHLQYWGQPILPSASVETQNFWPYRNIGPYI